MKKFVPGQIVYVKHLAIQTQRDVLVATWAHIQDKKYERVHSSTQSQFMGIVVAVHDADQETWSMQESWYDVLALGMQRIVRVMT